LPITEHPAFDLVAAIAGILLLVLVMKISIDIQEAEDKPPRQRNNKAPPPMALAPPKVPPPLFVQRNDREARLRRQLATDGIGIGPFHVPSDDAASTAEHVLDSLKKLGLIDTFYLDGDVATGIAGPNFANAPGDPTRDLLFVLTFSAIYLLPMPRRARHHDASRRYHDRVARQYDAIYDDPYWAFHDELTWRSIKPHVPRDQSDQCLDLGCGTGKWGLRLLKSGLATTFVDHSGAMIEQTRAKVAEMGEARARKATLLVSDIVDLSQLPDDTFALTLAMGDPLSICSDPPRAVREMHRVCKAGGVVIATADNKLAAIDHYVERGNLDALEEFLKTGRTRWLTPDEREQFELTTFTPGGLRKVFERSGFAVVELIGKTVIPVRENKRLLEGAEAVERLLRLEEELQKDPTTAARAGHLQIVARKASR
jgi:ubiquinone/menaquinone biosynthesis C-methylase UbiE